MQSIKYAKCLSNIATEGTRLIRKRSYICFTKAMVITLISVTFTVSGKGASGPRFVQVHRSHDMTNHEQMRKVFFLFWNADFDLCTLSCVPPLLIRPKVLPTDGTRTQQSINPSLSLHYTTSVNVVYPCKNFDG